jgi:hypothetical protein
VVDVMKSVYIKNWLTCAKQVVTTWTWPEGNLLADASYACGEDPRHHLGPQRWRSGRDADELEAGGSPSLGQPSSRRCPSKCQVTWSGRPPSLGQR